MRNPTTLIEHTGFEYFYLEGCLEEEGKRRDIVQFACPTTFPPHHPICIAITVYRENLVIQEGATWLFMLGDREVSKSRYELRHCDRHVERAREWWQYMILNLGFVVRPTQVLVNSC